MTTPEQFEQQIEAVSSRLAGPRKVWVLVAIGTDDKTFEPIVWGVNVFNTLGMAKDATLSAFREYFDDEDADTDALNTLVKTGEILLGDSTLYVLQEKELKA